MAKKAGTLAVSITANSTPFDRAIARAEKRIKNFAGGVKSALVGVGLAFGAKALLGAGKNFVDKLDNIGKRAGVLKISTERYQQFAFAAERTGTAIGSVESAVTRVNNVLARAAAGEKAAAASFNLVGLSVAELKSLKPDEVFDRVAESLATMEDPAAKNLAMLELFGKNGQELNNFLRDYVKLGDEAKANGAIIDESAIKAAEDINDQLVSLNKQLSAVVANLGMIEEASVFLRDFVDKVHYINTPQTWETYFKRLADPTGLGETFSGPRSLFTWAGRIVNPLGAIGDLGDRTPGTPWGDFFGYTSSPEAIAKKGAEVYDRLWRQLTGNSIVEQITSDAQSTGPVTQAQIAIADEARRQRIADKENRAAAAAERAARTQAELARRQAETATKNRTAAEKAVKVREPASSIAGSFSLRDLAMSVTKNAPAERTATATEKIAKNAETQTELQRKIAAGTGTVPAFG